MKITKRIAQGKNPLPVRRPQAHPLPWLDPSYPVKNWIDGRTGEQFQTATIQQDDGRFVSIIISDPALRFVGRTQQEAERGVSKLFLSRGGEDPREDEDDVRVIREREKSGKFVPLDTFIRRHRRAG